MAWKRGITHSLSTILVVLVLSATSSLAATSMTVLRCDGVHLHANENGNITDKEVNILKYVVYKNDGVFIVSDLVNQTLAKGDFAIATDSQGLTLFKNAKGKIEAALVSNDGINQITVDKNSYAVRWAVIGRPDTPAEGKQWTIDYHCQFYKSFNQ